jgi:flagellar basal body-associated protein FliL
MGRVGGIAKRLFWIALILVVVLVAGATALLGMITLRALPKTSGLAARRFGAVAVQPCRDQRRLDPGPAACPHGRAVIPAKRPATPR